MRPSHSIMKSSTPRSVSVCVRANESSWTYRDIDAACDERLYQGTEAAVMTLYVPADVKKQQVKIILL